MAMISCPECGKQISNRAISCPNCGCPINEAPAAAPAPAAQYDPAADIQKLTVLARRARKSNDGKNAKTYYAKILMLDPGNWEAIFYNVYYEASECRIMNISSAAHSVANSIYSTFAAIGDLGDAAEQDRALDDVIASAVALAKVFANSAINHYNQNSGATGAYSECSGRVVAATGICEEIENSFKKALPQKKKKLAKFQALFIEFLEYYRGWFEKNSLNRMINRLTNEASKQDPEYDLKNKISNLQSQIHQKTAQINSYPTHRETRAPVSALIALWVVSILLIPLGIMLYMDEDSLFLLILGVIGFCLAIWGSTKTPSKAEVEDNARRVRQLKQEIAQLQKQLRQLRGENVPENDTYTVQIKMYDTGYDSNTQCYATLQFVFTNVETGEVLGRGTQNQILTLHLEGPTEIKAHLGRGFRDAVLTCTPGQDSKYKLIPNVHSGLRFEETKYF